jgi:single-strand DNA-binding protein
VNNCTFAGRVGTVRELKYTSNGDAVFNFSVAVDRGKDKNGERRAPLWVAVTLWKEQAQNLHEFICKGDPIAVSGQAELRTYDAQDGPRTELTLLFPRVTLLGNNRQAASANGAAEAAADDEGVGF